jgi:hypothetical protein
VKPYFPICREGGQNAADLEPPCPLFPLSCTLPILFYLTRPFFWPRDTGDKVPASPEVELAMAVAQVC